MASIHGYSTLLIAYENIYKAEKKSKREISLGTLSDKSKEKEEDYFTCELIKGLFGALNECYQECNHEQWSKLTRQIKVLNPYFQESYNEGHALPMQAFREAHHIARNHSFRGVEEETPVMKTCVKTAEKLCELMEKLRKILKPQRGFKIKFSSSNSKKENNCKDVLREMGLTMATFLDQKLEVEKLSREELYKKKMIEANQKIKTDSSEKPSVVTEVESEKSSEHIDLAFIATYLKEIQLFKEGIKFLTNSFDDSSLTNPTHISIDESDEADKIALIGISILAFVQYNYSFNPTPRTICDTIPALLREDVSELDTIKSAFSKLSESGKTTLAKHILANNQETTKIRRGTELDVFFVCLRIRQIAKAKLDNYGALVTKLMQHIHT